MEVVVKHIADIVPERGSCGKRKKIITNDDCRAVALSHLKIEDARMHLHHRSYEIYYVLNGEGTLEVDDKIIAVARGTAVLIPPGKRHKAVSIKELEVLVIMSPPMAEEHDIIYV